MRLFRRISAAWRAAVVAWRGEAAVPQRNAVCWFDRQPGALAPPRSAEQIEADEWMRRHFRQRPWKGIE